MVWECERINEYRMARMVLMAEVSGGRVLARETKDILVG